MLSSGVIIWDDNTPRFIFPENFTHSSISAITLAVLLAAIDPQDSDENKCIENLLSVLCDIGRILYEILVEKYFPLQINQIQKYINVNSTLLRYIFITSIFLPIPRDYWARILERASILPWNVFT